MNNHFDVYISYINHDQHLMMQLKKLFTEKGISVCTFESLEPGTNWHESLLDMIRCSDYFVPIITQNSIHSDWGRKELEYAISIAEDRSGTTIPMIYNPNGNLFSNDSFTLQELLYRFPCISNRDQMGRLISEEDVLPERVSTLIYSLKENASNYELYEEYVSSSLHNESLDMLLKIIYTDCSRLKRDTDTSTSFYFYQELCDCMMHMDGLYWPAIRPDRKRDVFELLQELWDMIQTNELSTQDVVYEAFCVLLIDKIRSIDMCIGANWLKRNYIAEQDLHLEHMLNYSDNFIPKILSSKNSNNEKEEFCRCSLKHIINPFSKKMIDNLLAKQTDTVDFWKNNYEKTKNEKQIQDKWDMVQSNDIDTKETKLLHAVANFFQNGNDILNQIGEEESAEELLRCMLISYQRLKHFSEIVNYEKVCAECIQQIFQIEKSLAKLPTGSKTRSGIAEKGIRAWLGANPDITSDFDVFLSHKSEDLDIALGMYHFLHRNLLNPFLDKKLLPEMAESEYRKSIFQALDRCKHFVVIISKLEYLKSSWVSREMETFMNEKIDGRKPDGNFLIIVSDEVYKQIISSNKRVLPIEYRSSEIIRISEYKTTLLTYLQR